MNTQDLLNERNETHGSFIVNSRVGQGIKDLLRAEPGYENLNTFHREALDFIASKIGRIMAGQATFDDHWEDISGYALLPIKFEHGKEPSILEHEFLTLAEAEESMVK